MVKEYLVPFIRVIDERSLPHGGFSGQKGGEYSPEATAWSVLAHAAVGDREDLLPLGRSRLAVEQMEDGRISVSTQRPEAFWPTALAVIAWNGSPAHDGAQRRAVEFLLKVQGNHWEKRHPSPFGHDTSIRGWPWIERTHSWVEPTSMVLSALELTGNGEHERAQEGRRMLMDRQLETGGWNYGNTTVYGQKLRPMALSTGLALHALAGRIPRKDVQKSLSYLKSHVKGLLTPLSLGWTLLGLGAWGERPADAETLVSQCFHRQEVYGEYQTQHLGLLLCSFLGRQGLLGLLSQRPL